MLLDVSGSSSIASLCVYVRRRPSRIYLYLGHLISQLRMQQLQPPPSTPLSSLDPIGLLGLFVFAMGGRAYQKYQNRARAGRCLFLLTQRNHHHGWDPSGHGCAMNTCTPGGSRAEGAAWANQPTVPRFFLFNIREWWVSISSQLISQLHTCNNSVDTTTPTSTGYSIVLVS
ncbi:hypothetical protein B0H11DRAFT_549964 [Mycena galericulata]|nr:hypothetical protein B0H11DRAFT_549964 [Mycena galericulata]